MTVHAWVGDHLAAAAAGGAAALDNEEALLCTDFPHAAAGVAGAGAVVVAGAAAAVADFALRVRVDGDGSLDTGERFLERELKIVAQVRAARGVLASAARVHELAEDGREDVGKAVEPCFAEGVAAAVLERRPAETVVGCPLLRVLQDVIGFVDLLEAIRLLGATVVPVRMTLLGELTVRRLDCSLVRAARNAQQIVIILLDHYPSPLRRTGCGAAPAKEPRRIITPCSHLRRLRRTPHRRLLPDRLECPDRTFRHPAQPQLRSAPAAARTSPGRASLPPASARSSSRSSGPD